jgi:hypothetical protein
MNYTAKCRLRLYCKDLVRLDIQFLVSHPPSKSINEKQYLILLARVFSQTLSDLLYKKTSSLD